MLSIFACAYWPLVSYEFLQNTSCWCFRKLTSREIFWEQIQLLHSLEILKWSRLLLQLGPCQVGILAMFLNIIPIKRNWKNRTSSSCVQYVSYLAYISTQASSVSMKTLLLKYLPKIPLTIIWVFSNSAALMSFWCVSPPTVKSSKIRNIYIFHDAHGSNLYILNEKVKVFPCLKKGPP